HNAWTLKIGDKNEMLKVYEELDKVDDAIAELYSEETSITKDEAKQLMNESRDLTLDECLKYGFYTELENVKVVEVEETFNSIRTRNLQQRLNFNQNTMSKNKQTVWNKLKKDIDAFFGGIQNKIVFTADNSELDFYELGEDETPAIGDKARFDGKPAGDSNGGEYVIPNVGTYKFTGEELTEIVVSEDDDDNEVEN